MTATQTTRPTPVPNPTSPPPAGAAQRQRRPQTATPVLTKPGTPTTPDEWKHLLEAQARLHQSSLESTMAVLGQKPTAPVTTGYSMKANGIELQVISHVGAHPQPALETKGIRDRLVKWLAGKKYKVELADLPPRTHGERPTDGVVRIGKNLSPLEQTTALLHQTGHVALGHGVGDNSPRHEATADATAYMIGITMGLAMSGMSLEKVAEWSKSNPEQVRELVEQVRETVERVMPDLNPAMPIELGQGSVAKESAGIA